MIQQRIGDLLEIEGGGYYFYVVVLSKVVMFGGNILLPSTMMDKDERSAGRWLAEVLELPGFLAYGQDQDAALSKVQALALRVVAERLEHGEAGPQFPSISFAAA